MSILDKFLKSKDLKDYSELSEAEKETYREWEDILAGRKITDEDIQLFFDMELNDCLAKITNPNLPLREDVFLKMKIEFLTKTKAFLYAPKLEKKLLEDNIKQLMQ